MRPKKNGTPFVEMAQDRPYKLWMADLMECQECGAEILYTGKMQSPLAEHFEENFSSLMAYYKPTYQAKEWNR